MFDASIQKGEINIIKHFFGEKGKKYFLDLMQNRLSKEETFNPDLISDIDATALEAIGNNYNFLVPGSELQFYRSQLNRANKIINYLIQSLDLPKEIFGLRNEVAVFPDSASERLRKIANRDYVNSQLSYQVARQLMLAYLVSPLDERAITEKVETRLYDFQNFLDENLFMGKTGDTKNVDIYSRHDNSTNTLIDASEDFSKINGKKSVFDLKKESSHIKRKRFTVRSTNIDDIKVMTNMRHKGENESVIKAIMKAIKTGKPININETVSDSIGMNFMVVGNEAERDVFMAKFERLVLSYEGIDWLEVDDSPDNGRGQNKSTFKRRTQIYLKGLSIPIEIIFYSTSEYINSIREIGENYKGGAHILYELRRLGEAAEILFPKSVYETDIKPYIESRMEAIGDELRYVDQVDEKGEYL